MRRVVAMALFALAAPAWAQSDWQSAIVGHGEVLDVATNGEHAWSLGSDGLIIAWQGNPLVPRAWALYEGARFVLAHDADVIVAGAAEMVRLDRDTLEARERWPADGALDCPGAEVAWSWSERDGTARLHRPGDVATIRGGAVPNTTAACSLHGDDAWIAWFSDDSAWVLGYVDGSWSRARVPWPWAADPRVVPGPEGPRLYAVDDDGVPLAITPESGTVVATTVTPAPAWRRCARFDTDGAIAACRVRDERIARASLVPPAFPAHDAHAGAHGVTLVARHAWVHVSWDDVGVPRINADSSQAMQGYGVVAADVPLVMSCRPTPEGARFAAIDPTSGEARAILDVSAGCPDRAWTDAGSFAAATRDGVVRWREDHFEYAAMEHVVAATPGFGRADVGLVALRSWDTGCGGDADALWRTEAGQPVELVHGPLCDARMQLVPLDDGSGGAEGVALLVAERGRVRVASVELNGNVTELARMEGDDRVVIRVRHDEGNDALELDDARAAATVVLRGGDVEMTPLVARRGEHGVWSDGGRVQLHSASGDVSLVLDGADLLVETPTMVWATPAFTRRLAVARADGAGVVIGDGDGGVLTWSSTALRDAFVPVMERERNGFEGFGLIRRDQDDAAE